MGIKDLIMTARQAQEMTVDALTEYVREHGDDMCGYYYDEMGINDEDEDGVKVVKVLDVSQHGCQFAFQNKVNDDSLNRSWKQGRHTEAVEEGFMHYAVWALYIVRDAFGDETLKYYMFHSPGIVFDEQESEPDHDSVETLGLAELHYIFEAIIKNNDNDKQDQQ